MAPSPSVPGGATACQSPDVMATVAGGMAHEVNNPLTYVLANLHTIATEIEAAGGPQAARHGELLEEALEGVIRIRDAVRYLSVFARVESGAPVDLSDVLRATTHMLRAEVEGHAEFSVDLQQVPAVPGPPARMAQLFLCLLIHGNQRLLGLDKSDIGVHAGGMRVAVGPAADGCAEVKVVLIGYRPDCAPGAELQSETATSPCLSAAARYAQDLAAELSCAIDASGGCEFRLRIPTAPAAAASPPSPRVAAAVDTPLRVLVVDDEPLVRRMFAPERFGHEFVKVESGRAAIGALDDPRIDAVFCDVIMHDQGGMDVYEHVRRHRPALLSQFVFMTGGGFAGPVRRFLDSVDVVVLHKPFTLPDVSRVLASMRSLS